MIPPKKQVPEDKPKKFLVMTSTSDYLKLQTEAAARGTDLLSLCGCVLSAWVRSGCPDQFTKA
jgi:hypothetical protein